ncbi:MAG: class II glutamine amidotransferase [Acetobacteraceae bacterium]|nr:class II glutamine amidotransferase [Acetobacteraceae bacterium]
MCRWLAYTGPPLRIDSLLFQPQNSLIRQSLHATRGATTTNGDGFGLGWYGERGFPGVYRDILPAWHDANLRSLSEQIRSRLFFAHVRASSGTSTSRENCHPFRYGHALFMHNGQIGGYDRIRRDIENLIPADVYRHRTGTTDTEAFFLLAIGYGLLDDVPGAFARGIAAVREVMSSHGIEDPFRMTAALADGDRLYALRYASDENPPSLFFAEGGEIDVQGDSVRFTPGRGSVLVLSEPLDMHDGPWHEVPAGHVLETRGGVARVTPLP